MFALLILVVLVLIPVAPVAYLACVWQTSAATADLAARRALYDAQQEQRETEARNAYLALFADVPYSYAPERIATPPLPADYLGPIETFDLLGDDVENSDPYAVGYVALPALDLSALAEEPTVSVAVERRAAAAAVARHCAALRRTGVTQERALTVARCTRAAVGDGRYPAEVARLVAGM